MQSPIEEKHADSDHSKASAIQYEHLTIHNTLKNVTYTPSEYNMIQQFIEFAKDETKYQWCTKSSDIEDFKMEYIDSSNSASGMCIARGTTMIACNPEHLFFGYDDHTKIKDLDESIVAAELKYKYDDNRRIMSNSFKTPSPLWYREFLFKEIRSLIDDKGRIIQTKEDEKDQVIDIENDFAKLKSRSSVVLGFSIASDECPFEDNIRKQHVRCDLKFGGYYFENIGDNKCKATYVVCMDLKGWIPVWFQNMLLPQQAKKILTMKNYINSLTDKIKNSESDDDVEQ